MAVRTFKDTEDVFLYFIVLSESKFDLLINEHILFFYQMKQHYYK